MAEDTLISWADYTHNHFVGCTRVSPACDGCYAAHMMETRFHRVTWGGPGVGNGTRELTSESNRRKPLVWNKKAAAAGTRPFVFCSSLSDVFDNAIPAEWRTDLFDLIRATPNLVWLLLTKRPMNIIKMSEAAGGLPSNAAIGTTVEDQPRADQNIPHLVRAKNVLKPAFAFLSVEPMLEEIDLLYPKSVWPEGPPRCCGGWECGCRGMPTEPWLAWGIDWVISGGETDQGDHKARPSDPAWFRSLRGQCQEMGIPYHHKQNGEWVPAGHPSITDATENLPVNHSLGRLMVKVGKKRSGRLLDGVEHNDFPSIRKV